MSDSYQRDLESGIDYFVVLGIQETAEPADVVRAFRSRIREVHPDITGKPADPEHITRIVQARDVLTGPNRNAYLSARAARKDTLARAARVAERPQQTGHRPASRTAADYARYSRETQGTKKQDTRAPDKDLASEVRARVARDDREGAARVALDSRATAARIALDSRALAARIALDARASTARFTPSPVRAFDSRDSTPPMHLPSLDELLGMQRRELDDLLEQSRRELEELMVDFLRDRENLLGR